MTLDKVKKVIVSTVSCDEESVTLEANLKEDLGIDSLDAVEINLALEDEFGITIEDEEMAKFVTVKDIVDYIESVQ